VPLAGPLAPGDAIGSYRVDRKLAEGGMGVVYEAHHRFLARAVAIKVAHDLGGDDAGRLRRRFLREAQLLAALDHPGVVRVHDFGQLADGRPWMAMDLLDGETIAEILDRELVVPRRAVGWLRQLAQVLAAAHRQGAIHRDLKPDNVFVSAQADQVKLLDWGIAFVRAGNDPRLTRGGLVLGTPIYIAPEQARGLDVGDRADIYSLGVVAFELLTHRLPFDGPTDVDLAAQHVLADPPPLGEVWPDAPPRLDALVSAMLAKDPERRPDADEVDRELAAITPLLPQD